VDIFNVQEIYKDNKHNKAIDFIVVIRDIRSIITSKHIAVPDDHFSGKQMNTVRVSNSSLLIAPSSSKSLKQPAMKKMTRGSISIPMTYDIGETGIIIHPCQFH